MNEYNMVTILLFGIALILTLFLLIIWEAREKEKKEDE
jgi:hypothetical protein